MTLEMTGLSLADAGKISQEEALRNADSRNNLALRFRLLEGGQGGCRIKSEFTLNKKAPFELYSSFRVIPIKVKGGRPDAEAVVSEAVRNALVAKGLRQAESDPDLDGQFVFGIKKTKGLELTPVADERRVREQSAGRRESRHAGDQCGGYENPQARVSVAGLPPGDRRLSTPGRCQPGAVGSIEDIAGGLSRCIGKSASTSKQPLPS